MPVDSVANLTSSRLFSKAWMVFALLCILATTLARAEQPVELTQAFQHVQSGNYEQAFPVIQRFAREGSPLAQGTLARMYVNGWGIEKNAKEGFYWASRAAEKNDPTGMRVLGYIYWKGLAGFKKDLPLAVAWLEKVVVTQPLPASIWLAYIFAQLKDIDRMVLAGEAAFKHGEYKVAPWISWHLWRADKYPNNKKLSVEWLRRGAEAGDIKSMTNYGIALYESREENFEHEQMALMWWERASERDPDAALRASVLYGKAPYTNAEKLETMLKRAAGMGSPVANYDLAKAYFDGNTIIPQDKSKGYAVLNAAPKMVKLALLADLYYKGIDRPHNIQKAAFLFVESARAVTEKNGSWKKNSFFPLIFKVGDGTYAWEQTFRALDLPQELITAWGRFTFRRSPAANGKDDPLRSEEAPVIPKRSGDDYTFLDLIEKTEVHLQLRKKEFGPIEPRDLISEGFSEFLGKRGKVNEPLAQIFFEEALKVAIRRGDAKRAQSARFGLAMLFGLAANPQVKNNRLSAVHFLDAVENSLLGGDAETWLLDGLLWAHYAKNISLDERYLELAREKYKRQSGKPHPSVDSDPLPDFLINKKKQLQAKIALYDSPTENPVSKREQARKIAGIYEGLGDFKQAVTWYRLSDLNDETVAQSLSRAEKIVAGNYESGYVALRGSFEQLFEVDLTTRGALLTQLKSAISATLSPAKTGLSKKLKLYALVVGNSGYQKEPLKNSLNDAVQVAKKFRTLGFEVTEALNVDRKGFREALIRFSETTKAADVTLFYYSGHGMQLGGINYLLPTDLDFSMPQSVVTYDGVSLNEITDRSLNGATKIIFIDACRNNPFERVTRGFKGRGLAPMNVGTGTLISFATKDGSVAFDGVGGMHSPYTEALLRHIDREEDVELMLRTVGDEVLKMTNNIQQPWKYGALSGSKVILPLLSKWRQAVSR
jgi:TPR repeat protein